MEPFLPMLAVRAEPFDADDYVFEVKWDGVRALAGRDRQGWRLWGRDLAAYQERYPELEVLSRLPGDTVLDGEVVLLPQGLPDLDALLARHQRTGLRVARQLGRDCPVTYVVFDALYDLGQCLFGQPLEARRAVARQRVQELATPRVVFSDGVVGAGRALFERAVAQGQEGVMAKHRASRYLPGRRSAAWKKIKPARELPGVIVGYWPGPSGVRGVLVAVLCEGRLRYVADLCSGFTDALRRRLSSLLAERVQARPAVPCPEPAVWVRPELYCRVRFLAWTRGGRLRGASFGGLLPPTDSPAAAPDR